MLVQIDPPGAAARDGVLRRRAARFDFDIPVRVIEYIAEYDREYPVTGTDEYDHLLLKRMDEYTAEAVLSHGDKVYGSARRRSGPSSRSKSAAKERLSFPRTSLMK